MTDRRSSWLPEWLLPAGVPRGVWEYASAQHVADTYDEYFGQYPLFEFDVELLSQLFRPPGLVADLGCGTGRVAIALARRGLNVVAIDLSHHMLEVVRKKARSANISIPALRANLTELDCVADNSFDYCCCMFSTLGMIRGRQNRRRALRHAWRILKPGGIFVLHVHNLWFALRDPVSRRWLVAGWFKSLLDRQYEWGDKFYPYRGIPRVFVHSYRKAELKGDLRWAGFRIEQVMGLNVGKQRPLRFGWFLPSLRANGWIAVCSKPPRRLQSGLAKIRPVRKQASAGSTQSSRPYGLSTRT